MSSSIAPKTPVEVPVTGRPASDAAQAPAPPLVSLGLPVYNGEQFLIPCLDSLVNQTYPRYEIIISDNASTDGTQRICEEYARRDRRILYVRADRNQGSAWNHRRVLQLSAGPLFRWCGADDVIAPQFIQTCVDALNAQPDAILAFPRTVLIDEAGHELGRTRDLLPVESHDPVERFRSVLSALSVTQNAHYGVIRKEALVNVRPLQAFLAADRCLLAELVLRGPFVNVPDFLMYRRQHVENLTRTIEEEQRHSDPANVRPFRAREWRVMVAQLTAVAAAPVPRRTKLRLCAAATQRMWTLRRDFLYEGRWTVGQALARWLAPARRRDKP